MIKHIKTLFFLTLFFCMFTAKTLYAEESIENNIITNIYHETYKDLSNLPTIQIIQNNTQDQSRLTKILFEFGDVKATVQKADGSTEIISLRVKWDCFSKPTYIDYSVLGTYQETGNILLPDGNYIFGENVLQSLIFPVEIIVPKEPIVIASYSSDYILSEAYALSKGGDLSDILRFLPLYYDCFEQDGTTHLGTMIWDASQVDIHTPGVYKITGTPQLPMHAIAADDLFYPTSTCIVSVQEEGKPDINCFNPARGFFSFPWVTPPGNLDNVSAWISQNNGEWTQLSSDYFIASVGSFRLRTTVLTPGSSYKLQVDYDGGQTGILTFTYDNELFIESYNYGDRDGADAETTPPMDETTPDIPDLPENEIITDNNDVTSVGIDKKEDGSYTVTIVKNGVVEKKYTANDKTAEKTESEDEFSENETITKRNETTENTTEDKTDHKTENKLNDKGKKDFAKFIIFIMITFLLAFIVWILFNLKRRNKL